MNKEKRVLPLEEFEESLWNLVRDYAKCSGITIIEAAGQGIAIFTSFMTQAALGRKVPRETGKRTPEDIKTDDEDDDESTGQCMAIHPGNIRHRLNRTEAPKMLRQFIKRTAEEFETMLSGIPLSKVTTSGGAKLLATDDPDEISTLGYQCFLASEVNRFPYTLNWVETWAVDKSRVEETAYRILRAIQNPPCVNDKDQQIVEVLNKESKRKFELNQMTFSDGKYRGTPDAILKAKGVITSVAEFKASSRSEAENQLIVYLTMFKLSSGWIVLGPPSKAQVIKVTLDDMMVTNQAKRLDYYQKFINTLIRTGK